VYQVVPGFSFLISTVLIIFLCYYQYGKLAGGAMNKCFHRDAYLTKGDQRYYFCPDCRQLLEEVDEEGKILDGEALKALFRELTE